ncbi:MAG: hypothetical protein H6817_02755 [Phycisphaerales bacterium]|nr:hypothetical protein [Phycisphaerales bacterium]
MCNGQLLEAVKLDPKIANFGRISPKPGTTPERKIVITRADAGPISPSIIPIKDEDVSAELKTIVEGERYELIVQAHPKANATSVRGRIAVKTGLAEEPTVNINVFGTILPRVSYRPSSFMVPSTGDASWKQSVEIVWNEGQPGQLLSAAVNNPKLQATAINSGNRRRVELTLTQELGDAGLPAGVEVTVTTDDKDFEEVVIPVRLQPVRKRGLANRPEPRKAKGAKPVNRETKSDDDKPGEESKGAASDETKSPTDASTGETPKQ